LNHALLGGLAVVLFHASLFKVYRDSWLTLAAWLLLVLVAVIINREIAVGVRPDARSRLTRAWAGVDNVDLAMLTFFLVLLLALNAGYLRATADGREYFAQVRSLVIDGDLDFANENRLFRSLQPQTFPFGTAVLWVPFFLAAHLWIGLLNLGGAELWRNGFSNPYQMAIGVGTLVYGCVGLLLVYRIARDYFSERVAAVATVVVTAASFLVWYLVMESSASHGAAMFSTTLFLFAWHRTRAQRTSRGWLGLGLAGGLMTMVRWQNAVYLLFPLADGVERMVTASRADDRSAAWGATGRDALAFTAAYVVALAPQLIFFKVVNGGWLSPPPGQTGQVLWTEPLVVDVLFSSNHGLLSWHPILWFAMLGVPLFVLRDLRFGGLLTAVFIAQIYVNGAVDQWWGGPAFGARRFASCALLFVLGLAALISRAERRPLFAITAVLLVLVAGNAAFMIDIRTGQLMAGQGIAFDQMFASTYRRVGNPFSFPANLVYARRYGISPWQYDQLGLRIYNNLHLVMGSGATERFLGSGWAGLESNDAGAFRWAVGEESIVLVPLKSAVGGSPSSGAPQADYEVRFRAQPFRFPGAPPQSIELWANGALAGRQRLVDELREYVIPVPGELLRRNINVFRFRYGYAHAPGGEDSRLLAVRFERIDFIRKP
jgi:hypothetical protein